MLVINSYYYNMYYIYPKTKLSTGAFAFLQNWTDSFYRGKVITITFKLFLVTPITCLYIYIHIFWSHLIYYYYSYRTPLLYVVSPWSHLLKITHIVVNIDWRPRVCVLWHTFAYYSSHNISRISCLRAYVWVGKQYYYRETLMVEGWEIILIITSGNARACVVLK